MQLDCQMCECYPDVIAGSRWSVFYLHKLGKYNKDKMQSEGLKLIAWTSEGSDGAKKADEANKAAIHYYSDHVLDCRPFLD